jgi:hypothetical protein
VIEEDAIEALARLGFVDTRSATDVPWALITIANVTTLANQLREECLLNESTSAQRFGRKAGKTNAMMWEHRRLALEQILKTLASN